MSDLRLRQLARMLSLSPDGLDLPSARAIIAARPADFADALFAEAAQNDDVTSTTAALDYLEARLLDFPGLVGPEILAGVRAAFAARLVAWV